MFIIINSINQIIDTIQQNYLNSLTVININILTRINKNILTGIEINLIYIILLFKYQI